MDSESSKQHSFHNEVASNESFSSNPRFYQGRELSEMKALVGDGTVSSEDFITMVFMNLSVTPFDHLDVDSRCSSFPNPNLAIRIDRLMNIALNFIAPYQPENFGFCPIKSWSLSNLYPLHLNSISRIAILISNVKQTSAEKDSESAIDLIRSRNPETCGSDECEFHSLIESGLQRFVFSEDFPLTENRALKHPRVLEMSTVYINNEALDIYADLEHLCCRVISRLMEDYLMTVLREILKNMDHNQLDICTRKEKELLLEFVEFKIAELVSDLNL
ncbi:hypothetical protein HK096_005498 [Nowakowskiella sp. JEL0078]|nr:hypothetical protein HK096_005498 [Nowakowskiella sp. JEL0078]